MQSLLWAALAFVLAYVEDFVSIRRQQAVTANDRHAAAEWSVVLGAILLAGTGLFIESRWYAIPLLLGYYCGAYRALE